MPAYGTARLLSDLKSDEGCKLTAYKDSVGVWTIGYGHTRGVIAGQKISQDEAVNFLLGDMTVAVNEMEGTWPWSKFLSEPRWRGLSNMSFNLGIQRLSGFKHMLEALRMGAWDRAAGEALDSSWASEVGDRAKRIAELFKNG